MEVDVEGDRTIGHSGDGDDNARIAAVGIINGLFIKSSGVVEILAESFAVEIERGLEEIASASAKGGFARAEDVDVIIGDCGIKCGSVVSMIIAGRGILLVDAIDDDSLAIGGISIAGVVRLVIFDNEIFLVGWIALDFDGAAFAWIDELWLRDGDASCGFVDHW